MIEHDVGLIMRLCDRVQVLAEGRTICVGSPDEVQRDPDVIAAYLGTRKVTVDA
jgi:ABC-type branched-subunit amino acid transport system ATPase component